MILLSAFSIIYIKDLNRRLFIHYQVLQATKTQALVEKGKLLLEQSTWSAQTRIQHIAVEKLKMHVPHTGNIVLISVMNNHDRTR